ncbi:MAG TPA: hypothetical protein VMM54_14490 [Nitrospirota bacterium]|nr:hypothetical protein [Nitrospirota bacterium]
MHNVLFFIHRLLSLVKRKDLWRVLVAASALAAFVLAGAVRAGAEEELLPDKFMLRLGGYHTQNADTVMRLDANNLPIGTYIDFHDTLGGDTTTTVFRMDGLYRFNDKHAIGFSWYRLRYSGSTVLGQDIEWGGNPIAKGQTVDSELKFDVYKINYQYSVYHNDKVELGASVGLHIMRISASVNAPDLIGATSEAVTAPLPEFGLFADYKFTPRFSIFYSYQWFFINYEDKVRGGLQDFLFGLEYRVFRNVALGVAYNRFAMNLKAQGDTTTLYANTNWNGGMLYGALYF